MTYRPWSSVTTTLANFVGSSVVSAITHTPASGPDGPRTTPPMSSLSMATAACWAIAGDETEAGNTPASAAKPMMATVEYKTYLRFMFALPWVPGLAARCLGVILHPTRPVLRASESCDDVARPRRFQWPAAAGRLGNAPAFFGVPPATIDRPATSPGCWSGSP